MFIFEYFKRFIKDFSFALRLGQEEETGGLKEQYGTLLAIQLATWVVGLLAM